MNKICKECKKEAVTHCDKCSELTCRECSRIVVDKPTDVDVLIYHKKCVPKKYQKKLEVIA